MPRINIKSSSGIEFEWEKLTNSPVETYRAKTPFGWIVMFRYKKTDIRIGSENIVYIPDPDHEWRINK